jgi:hypothetical protein
MLLAMVGGLLLPARSAAQGRLFVDLGGGGQQPTVSTFSQIASFPLRAQTGIAKDDYRLKIGPAFDAGAGFMVTRRVGVVVSASRATTLQSADFSLTLPHPVLLSQSVTRTATTAEHLLHGETTVHIDLLFVALTKGRLQVSIFGGGSHVRVEQRLLGDDSIAETLNLTTRSYDFAFTNSPKTQLDAVSRWGGNVGGQLLIAVGGHLSVGGLVRETRATASVRNAVAGAFQGVDVRQPLTMGGVAAVATVRVRF